MPFRILLHHGQVFLGGLGQLGEGSLLGKEINFVFCLEKLAGSLGESRLLSEAAHTLVHTDIATTEAGRHSLSGWDGLFLLYRF